MTLKDKATVERLLGVIEGVAFALDDKYAQPICDAVVNIDEILDKECAQTMTDRDRLIELQIKAYKEWQANTNMETSVAEFAADYLLANGVIVPPCKVGDRLYIIASISQEIIESVVIGMWIVEDSVSILTIHGTILNDSLGETVFLTKEEAEAKLKERENNA